jgi:L-malate glycosyltransferase
MRILQLVTVRQRRGAEVFATQLSDALAERGHEVVLVGLLPPGDNPLSPVRARVEDVNAGSVGRLNFVRLSHYAKILRRIQPDVVQANGSQTLKYSSLARRLSAGRVPLVYRNISMASEWVRGPLHRKWVRWLVGAIDHVSSVSTECSRDFGSTYGVPAERRSVIRRGILVPDKVAVGAARHQLQTLAGIPQSAQILLHTGSFTDEKNHIWLVETFRRIVDSGRDVHLVLIGDGELKSRVEAHARESGIGQRIHLLGIRNDAADLVAGADVFVLPSKIEGIPGALLEAAAQGVPSVATDVGGMQEAVSNGQSGLLVASGDHAAFTAAVLRLLGNEEERRAMGVAARDLVVEKFSMNATASAFESLYERLISGQGS